LFSRILRAKLGIKQKSWGGKDNGLSLRKKIKLDKELLSLLLPSSLTALFQLDRFEQQNGEIHFFLSEKNIPPVGFKDHQLLSKGFFDEATLRDFPLRGKPCFLHLKRRKWLHSESGKIVFNDWHEVAEGTRLTVEFAAFLKGYH
jgi:hypothetical protein